MGLSIGSLNRKVQIRKKTLSAKPNGAPGQITTWPVIATVWAKVEGLAGREAVIGESLQGIAAYRITMRYRTDFGPADQLRYGSIDLNVRSVTDPDGRREALIVIADTGSTQKTG